MNKLSDDEILKERERLISDFKKKYSSFYDEINVLDSFITDDEPHNPMWYLGKSLEILSKAHVIYMADDWYKNRGCKLERDAAEAYGVIVIYEHIDYGCDL